MTQFTDSQLALKAHIEAKNKEFGFSACSDLVRLAEDGITTIEEFERQEAITEFYYAYAENNEGRKPRWMDFSKYTTQELIDMAHYENNRDAIITEENEKVAAENAKRNAYQPNLPFAGLKDLMAA